jgi:predicted porin
MKRKAIALAVGALFAAPAAHAQITFGNESIGTMQLYGKLYPEFGQAKGQNSTQVGSGVSTLVSRTGVYTSALAGTSFVASEGRVPDHTSRSFVDSQNSYLGFRGERSLSPGLKGIWQIEQSVELDTGTGTFSSRNSFVGLSHRMLGTVKLGKMDSIYKEYGDTFAMFGISSGNFVSASNVLSHIGIGTNNNARFHERYNNSLQYQTAELAGFQAGVQYVPDEREATRAEGATSTSGRTESNGTASTSTLRCTRNRNMTSSARPAIFPTRRSPTLPLPKSPPAPPATSAREIRQRARAANSASWAASA